MRLPTLLAVLAAVAVLLVQARDGTSGATSSDASVQRVVDGDTVVLSGIGKVRLIGIDTPEVYGHAECYGAAASEHVKRWLRRGTPVRYRLGVEPHDRYGRALAYVWTRDGTFVNASLARDGYATQLTIPPNVEYADRFRTLVREAREARRGLWRSCHAQ